MKTSVAHSYLNQLHIAAQTGDIMTLSAMLNARVDPNLQTTVGKSTALHAAARFNRVESIKTLLNARANPNIIDSQGQTPIDKARTHNSIDAIEALIPVTASTEALKEQDAKRQYQANLQAQFNRSWSGKVASVASNLPLTTGEFHLTHARNKLFTNLASDSHNARRPML